MPRPSAWSLPCTLTRRRTTTGVAWLAEMTIASNPRRRVRGQGPTAPIAVARLVVRLRARGLQDRAAVLTDAAVAQYGVGWLEQITAQTPHAGPPLHELLTAHVEARHRLGYLQEASRNRGLALVRNHVRSHEVGAMRLTELDPPTLRRLLADLLAAGSTGPGITGTRTLHGFLRQLCDQAVEDGRLTRSPMAGVALPAKPRPKTQTVGYGGGDSVLARAAALLADVSYDDYLLVLPLAMGLRTSERLGLTHASLAYRADGTVDVRIHAQLDREAYPLIRPILKTAAGHRTLAWPTCLRPHLDAIHLRRLLLAVARGETNPDYAARDGIAAEALDAAGVLPSEVLPHGAALYARPSDGQPLRHQHASRTWARIRATHLPDETTWTEHNWRRVARTALAAAGVPDTTAEVYLGHSLDSLGHVYTRPEREDLLAAAGVLADRWHRTPAPYTGPIPADLHGLLEVSSPATMWRPADDFDAAGVWYREAAAAGGAPADLDAHLRHEWGIDIQLLWHQTAWWPQAWRAIPADHLDWAYRTTPD